MIETEKLRRIAIYLEGVKAGRGDILPLGNADLEELWSAIRELNQRK